MQTSKAGQIQKKKQNQLPLEPKKDGTTSRATSPFNLAPAKKHNFRVEVITVTPKMAEDWLTLNTANRDIRQSWVDKYTTDMKDGNWTQCYVPITWIGDDVIADGQHRLWAQVLSQTTQKWIVVWGATKDDLLNFDRGLARNLIDNMHFSGSPRPTPNECATVRWIEWGRASPSVAGNARGRPASDSEVRALIEKHGEAARYADNRIKGKGIRKAAIAGAIGRAWYAEKDHDALARFCSVLSTGMANGEHESAAIALRNTCLSMAMRGVNSHDAMTELFLKAQNAVHHFMRGRKLTMIKNVASDVYPLKV